MDQTSFDGRPSSVNGHCRCSVRRRRKADNTTRNWNRKIGQRLVYLSVSPPSRNSCFPKFPLRRASSAVIGAAANDDARSDATSLDHRRSSDHHASSFRSVRAAAVTTTTVCVRKSLKTNLPPPLAAAAAVCRRFIRRTERIPAEKTEKCCARARVVIVSYSARTADVMSSPVPVVSM